MNSPWIILGHYLWVQQWKSFFRPSKEKITTTRTWIRFRGLPNECFRKRVVARPGNLVGKVLKVDTVTLTASRAPFARVYIEVNLQNGLRPSVVLNGSRYQVEYEGFQMICFDCGKFGHKADECPEKIVVKDAIAENVVSPPMVAGPTPDRLFGPWMIVDTRRRRPNVQYRNQNNHNNINKASRDRHNVNQQQRGYGSRFDVLLDDEEARIEAEAENQTRIDNELERTRKAMKKVQYQSGKVNRVELNLQSAQLRKPEGEGSRNRSHNKSKLAREPNDPSRSSVIHIDTEMQSLRENSKRKEQADINAQKAGSKHRFHVQKNHIVIRTPLNDMSNVNATSTGQPVESIRVLNNVEAGALGGKQVNDNHKNKPPDVQNEEMQQSMEVDNLDVDPRVERQQGKDLSKSS